MAGETRAEARFGERIPNRKQARADATVMITNANLFLHQKRLAELAIKSRLPTMFQGTTRVESGGLMSYSTGELDAFRRAAYYVDRILVGIELNSRTI